MPKVQRVCQRCEKIFELYPSQIRSGGGTFCSRACQNVKSGEDRNCLVCGASFYATRNQIQRGFGKYCSRKCGAANNKTRSKNPNWKGGRFKRSDGYIAIGVGLGEYRLEHDLVMEKHLGRRLRRGENVHHLNEVRDDNRLGNLKLMDWAAHIKEHHPNQPDLSKWVTVPCLNCRKVFAERKAKIKRHPHCFCSRECYLEGQAKGLCP